VLRHALAGVKDPDPGRDAARGLDAEGRATARALPTVFAGDLPPTELLSSPFARCIETLVPLRERLGLPVVIRDGLRPDAPSADVKALLLEVSDGALLCTHGETIACAFDGLACEKGAFWIVRRREGTLEPLRYVPPIDRHDRSAATLDQSSVLSRKAEAMIPGNKIPAVVS